LKSVNITYALFYISFLTVLVVAVFLEKKYLLYVKPLATVSLIVLYLDQAKTKNVFVIISLVVIMATDTFTYIDFEGYFERIASLITVFYSFCVLALRGYLSEEEVNPAKLVSVPVIISAILISYLIYTITEMVFPKIEDSIVFVVMIVIGLVTFFLICFFIYVADRFEKSIFLFVAGCCTMFVDALLAVNELYYYTTVFTVLINFAEILGLYFFIRFFIQAEPKDMQSLSKEYF